MTSAIREVMIGLAMPLRGFSFIKKHPRLWPLAIMPTLITALFLALLIYGASVWSADWVHSLSLDESPSVEEFNSETLGTAFGVELLKSIGRFLLKGLFFLLAGILAVLLGKIAAAPFNDALSQGVERLYTGKELEKQSGNQFVSLMRSSWWAVIWEAKKVIFYLLVLFCLFILNVFPVIGSLMYASLAFLFNVGFMAFDYMDFPLERRPGPRGPLGLRERVRLLWGYKWSMLGFGATTSLLLFVPFVNFLFLPLAVSGATLLYIDLETASVET